MNLRITRHIFASLLIASLAIPAFSQGIFDQSADWSMIGSVKLEGSATESGGVYNIKGNGNDIWGAADEGYYIYTEKAGDGSISAKVTWLSPGGNEWAKVAVMIRDGAESAGAVNFVSLLRAGPDQNGDQSGSQWRSEADQSSSSVTFYDDAGERVADPGDGLYIRASRLVADNMVIGEWSLDGTTWNLGYVGPLEMSETVAYGLAVTNHDDLETIAEAEVSDVVLSDDVVSAAYRSIDGEPVYKEQDSRTVSITVGGQGTLTLEETPPAGWTISDISDGGTLADGTITWTLDAGTTVSYIATSGDDITTDAVFTGTTADYEIYGEDTIVAPQPVGDFDNHMDIGAVAAAGSAEYDSGDDLYTISGSGADLWGTADEFHYLYKNISGAFMIEGNVFAYHDTSTNEWSKCGFMVREDLGAGSKNVIATMRPSDAQITTQWRLESNSDTANSGLTANDTGLADLRLVRTGSFFKAYYSLDGGAEWILNKEISASMNNDVKLGMAITSHDDGLIAFAEFMNVTITEYPFAVYKDISATELNPGAFFDVTLEVYPRDGESPNITITETYTEGLSATIDAGAGEATDDGNGTITWTANGLTEPTTIKITYEVDPAIALPFVEIAGSFDDGAGYSGDTEMLNIPVETLSDLGIFQGHEDVGSVGAGGNVLFDGETWTVVASGADIWGTADQMHYLWARVEGDFVFSIDAPYVGAYGSTPSASDWQKMGIMARQDLTAGSTYVFNLLRSSDQNLVQQRREVAGSDALSNDEYFAPVEWNLNWDPAADGILNPSLDDVTLGGTLVMAREDGVFFTSEYVDAGGERVLLAGIELEMTDPIYIGVAVTSHENPNLSQGIFKNPQLDGNIVAVKGWMLY